MTQENKGKKVSIYNRLYVKMKNPQTFPWRRLLTCVSEDEKQHRRTSTASFLLYFIITVYLDAQQTRLTIEMNNNCYLNILAHDVSLI